MKNYEGITLPIYRPWDLENSEFFQVPEPIVYSRIDRNFPSPRAYIEEDSSEFFQVPRTFSRKAISRIGRYQEGGGGEREDMKHVNLELPSRAM